MAQIRIMVSRHSAFYSPLIATLAGGFLREEGLEGSYAPAPPGVSPWSALMEGSIDVAQLAVSASWRSMENGESPEIAHFAQINERDGFFIAARTPDPGFTWDKLKGRSVLVDHFGQPLAMFKYAAHKMNLDFAEIEPIDAGEPDAMEAAFRAGQGDYVHLQGPAPQQLEKDGVGHVVASVGAAIGPVAFSSLAAHRRWLETETALAFMRAYRKGRQYVIGSPAVEIAAVEADFFKGVDREVLARTIQTYQDLDCWTPEVEISRESYAVGLDVFQHSEVITKRHAYEDVVVPPPDQK